MKKTLFLSAILGAALCSSAFAETVTVYGTRYDAAVATANDTLTAAPTEDYILLATGKNGNWNVNDNTWLANLTSTKTLIAAPASKTSGNTTGGRLHLNGSTLSDKVNIIAGGSGGDDIYTQGNSTIKGDVTIVGNSQLQVWLQSSNLKIDGTLNGTGKTLKLVGNDGAASSLTLSGGGTVGTLLANQSSGNVVLSATNSTGGAAKGTTYTIGTLNAANVATSFTVQNGVTATIGTLGSGYTGTISNAGTLSINGGTMNKQKLTNTGTLNLSGTFTLKGTLDGMTFGDDAEHAAAAANGYAYGTGTYNLLANGSTGTFSANNVTFNVAGYGMTSQTVSNEGVVSFDASTAAGKYFVNTNALAYTAGSAAASDATTSIVVTTATTITLGEGATLNHSKMAMNAATTVTGNGHYVIETPAGNLNNVEAILGDYLSFSGKDVQLTIRGCSGSNFYGVNLGNAKFGATDAVIEISGIDGGYIGEWQGTLSRNIKLTNNDTLAAWKWSNGTGDKSARKTITFSGAWSGTGTLENAGSSFGQNFTWSGDISDWEGAFKLTGNTAISNVTFTGSATTVNAALTGASGTTLNVVADADTQFNKDITAANLTVNSGKAAKLNATATLGTLTLTGDLHLLEGSKLTTNSITGGAWLKVAGDSIINLNGNGTTINNLGAYTATINVGGSQDVTIANIYEDVSGVDRGTFNVVLNNGAHKTTISTWLTVNSVSMKNGQELHLNNHTVDTLNIGAGAATISGSSTNNTNGHTINNIVLADGADLLAKQNENMVISALTMGNGSVITVGSADNHAYDLTTSTLTVNGDSTMNANLVVSDNGTMDFSNHTELTMGCTVTIGDHVTIKIDDSELAGIVNTGSVMTIINDVEGVNMNNLALTLGSGWKFVDAQGNSLDAYNLRLDVVDAGNGKVNIVVAPEPATATLSLLALAALASRRKRH